MTRRQLLGGFAACLAAACAPRHSLILAAASLQPWLDAEASELGCDFSYGGSYALEQQVQHGADPLGLLLADSPKLALPSAFGPDLIFARNQLVLVARGRTPSLDELKSKTAHLSMADPQLAPVGVYAREALQNLKLWEAWQGRLTLSSDDRAALLHLESGHADLALVYRSDLARRKDLGGFVALPESSHRPIAYHAFVQKTGAGETVGNWLKSPACRASLESYGFLAGPAA